MSGIPAGAGSLLGKRLGKYEILALLALGGTAEIYLARIGGAAGFEKYVVVKCLHDHLADDPEFVKMFLDEARLAAHLDHSNIVQTMELGEHENRYYMVMEFLAGLSLSMMCRRATERLSGGRLPAPLVLNMMAQACGGLHYAHERQINGKPLGIVHRDISPQNLVVSFEGVVKIVDFGIAKAELRETKTRTGTIKGKFAYMSPEQCVANNVDRRTDVFALGVITHEMLTGRRLFKRTSPYETYQAVIECKVEPPSATNIEIDPALDPVVMKAIAKDRDQRYPTAEAFGDALMSYLHHRGKSSGPGDIGRFFEQSFANDIEEHSARMRELISGRELAVETGVSGWGSEADRAAEQRQNETVDISRGRREEPDDKARADDNKHHGLMRPSVTSLSDVLGDLGENAGDDTDLPADRTRIEVNPHERMNELEQAADAARASARAVTRPQTPPDREPETQPFRPVEPTLATQPEGALGNRAQQYTMPPSGPLPLPAPPNGFPDLANLPTMTAGVIAERPPPELAPTALSNEPVIALGETAEIAAGNGRYAEHPKAPRCSHGRASDRRCSQRSSLRQPVIR